MPEKTVFILKQGHTVYSPETPLEAPIIITYHCNKEFVRIRNVRATFILSPAYKLSTSGIIHYESVLFGLTKSQLGVGVPSIEVYMSSAGLRALPLALAPITRLYQSAVTWC